MSTLFSDIILEFTYPRRLKFLCPFTLIIYRTAILFDTGARISELMELKRCDIKFDKFGAILRIPTVKRRSDNMFRSIRINASLPSLEKWLIQIPDKSDQYVWTEIKNKNKRMSYDSAYVMIKYTMKMSGIKKNIYPHIFRHSSVTYWHAKGLPEGVLKKRVGWTADSNMLRRYSHINER